MAEFRAGGCQVTDLVGISVVILVTADDGTLIV